MLQAEGVVLAQEPWCVGRGGADLAILLTVRSAGRVQNWAPPFHLSGTALRECSQ